ncbi:MAG: T9SS type A sorting domain-containing protein [Saprospiraceae bacterium]|nr:T9SS type A sorting domain-containing protein [Saprospiraceae bacterium]MBP7679900.1 T9SS type A sorting domain-containing protein [Saprospiraceae bacterium]
MKKSIISIILLTLYTYTVYSQVTISATQHHIQPTQIVNVSLNITGYQDILSTQFSVKWDTTILTYIGANNYNLPGLGSNNFNNMNASQGILTFAWYDQDIQGIDLPDGSTIFSLRFVGKTDGISPITIDTVPTDIEVGSLSGILQTVIQNGEVAVGNTMAVEDNILAPNQNVALYQNIPNPFKDATVIPFALREGADVTAELTDATGSIVWSQKQRYPSGKHQIRIDSTQLHQAGTYQYSLKINEQKLTKKMIFIR